MKTFIRTSAIMLTTGVFMVGAYAPAIAAYKSKAYVNNSRSYVNNSKSLTVTDVDNVNRAAGKAAKKYKAPRARKPTKAFPGGMWKNGVWVPAKKHHKVTNKHHKADRERKPAAKKRR
ncbi:MAG: hypothetical protein COB66_06845 [Coxiella sp. (in: Bacteria)]|nr:MAG: hypothetical protein COB66_06845 [Coxiella sp. (in: g-proteobacteria)]